MWVNVLMWSYAQCLRMWLGMMSLVTDPTSVQSLCLRLACPGEIDLTGIFPLYIDIRRGSIIAVTFVRVYQPWQLVDCAPSFLYVISSFSILLAPIVGMMVADFYFVQKMRLKLSEPHGDFWYSGWVNWRAFPAWIVGWAPTIGGLILVSTPELRRDLPFPKRANIRAQVFSPACWSSTSQTWYSQSAMSEIWVT